MFRTENARARARVCTAYTGNSAASRMRRVKRRKKKIVLYASSSSGPVIRVGARRDPIYTHNISVSARPRRRSVPANRV